MCEYVGVGDFDPVQALHCYLVALDGPPSVHCNHKTKPPKCMSTQPYLMKCFPQRTHPCPRSKSLWPSTASRHGFILCGTQSTKKSPTWYKIYAIVCSVSIHTYKKCYAGAIFEYSENNGASQKSSLACLDLLSYLLSENGLFSVTAQVPRHSCFSKKKLSARAPSGLWVRTIESNNKKQTQTKKPPVDRPCPFRSTARIDRVMGDPAYDRRRLNQPEGDITQQSTMAICVEKILHQKRPCNDRLPLPVGCLHPFCSTACVDRVMGDLAYDFRLLNQAGGGGGVFNPANHQGDL